MKECKEATIPCYRDGYGVWHYLDGTRDKVYELNKQMSDIDKHLSEAGYFRMICDGQIETRKKLIDMEEKKTKKMTKAEAFEYLKGKKVDTNGRDEAVQMKLFECGICWASGDFTYQKTNSGKLLITSYGRFFHCGGGDLPNCWEEHPFEKISVDDILSIEIVKEEKEPLDKWEEFARRVAKIQETLEDDEMCIITKTNYLTMTK